MSFIPVAQPVLGEEEARAVYDVVKSGWITMGKKVQAFERAMCDLTGASHAVAMNNGTSTLHAILAALDIGPGDEVIVPSMTYISSVNVVLFVGATPVLCDNDPRTFNTTVEHVRAKITPRTKAIMTVDMKGLPVDYDAFAALSEETGIPFVSDSAESMGAIDRGRRIGGTPALAHSFSFFANKAITTGEGGMVTTENAALAERLRIFRNQGQEGRYNHTYLGQNYRMTDITAAIGIEQVKRLPSTIAEKQRLATRYTEAFAAVPGVTTPYLPDHVDQHSWYMYGITLDAAVRDGLLKHLADQGIETRLSFPPTHIQPYHQKRFGWAEDAFPTAMNSYRTFLDIPIWPGLGDAAQDRVIGEISGFLRQAR